MKDTLHEDVSGEINLIRWNSEKKIIRVVEGKNPLYKKGALLYFSIQIIFSFLLLFSHA